MSDLNHFLIKLLKAEIQTFVIITNSINTVPDCQVIKNI